MNNHYPHPIFAREGIPILVLILAGAICVQYFLGNWAGLPWWLGVVFVLQFFRDPARVIAGNSAKSVVSPADGRIVAVEETDDTYLQRRAIKVSVFMNVFNVHSNRSPIDCEVKEIWYNKGKFINADLAKASVENERCAMHLRADNGQDVTCVQVAGLIARRILNYMDPGMKLVRGQRYGFIRFGSRVDVYLPLDAKVKVAIGEKVYASSTLLAELA